MNLILLLYKSNPLFILIFISVKDKTTNEKMLFKYARFLDSINPQPNLESLSDIIYNYGQSIQQGHIYIK